MVILLGILAIVFSVSFKQTHSELQTTSAVRMMATHIRYARELAMTSGQGTRVFMDIANNRYTLKWADGAYLTNPVGGGNFIVNLGVKEFGEVQMNSTGFTNGNLDFTTGGLPRNDGNPFSGARTLVVVNDEVRIVVWGNTGLVETGPL